MTFDLSFCPSSDSKNIIFWPQIKTNNRLKFDANNNSVILLAIYHFVKILSFSIHPVSLHSFCLFALILSFCIHPDFFCIHYSLFASCLLPFALIYKHKKSKGIFEDLIQLPWLLLRTLTHVYAATERRIKNKNDCKR